jgi:hypothetical protein
MKQTTPPEQAASRAGGAKSRGPRNRRKNDENEAPNLTPPPFGTPATRKNDENEAPNLTPPPFGAPATRKNDENEAPNLTPPPFGAPAPRKNDENEAPNLTPPPRHFALFMQRGYNVGAACLS